MYVPIHTSESSNLNDWLFCFRPVRFGQGKLLHLRNQSLLASSWNPGNHITISSYASLKQPNKQTQSRIVYCVPQFHLFPEDAAIHGRWAPQIYSCNN